MPFSTLFPHSRVKDYPCYRDYVIVTLPQLDSLDGHEITRTERLKAAKKFEENRREVVQLQVSEER